MWTRGIHREPAVGVQGTDDVLGLRKRRKVGFALYEKRGESENKFLTGNQSIFKYFRCLAHLLKHRRIDNVNVRCKL